jgi:prepilin-type N-terminal cleavage/methylation domain-containing protein
MNRTRNRGLTLLEVVVAVAIAGTVLSLVIPIFVTSSRSAGVQAAVEVAERSSARVIALLRKDLRAARLTEVASSPEMPAITFRLPQDGGGVDADGAIVWGQHRTIIFESVETIDEGARGIDLNSDGDTADRFLRCRLREIRDDGSSRSVSGAHFVLNADDPYGDIDGDGVADPAFTAYPAGLRIVLWSVLRSDVAKIRRASIDITLRNPQGG